MKYLQVVTFLVTFFLIFIGISTIAHDFFLSLWGGMVVCGFAGFVSAVVANLIPDK